MLEYSTQTVLVKSNAKKQQQHALPNGINDHRKKYSQSNPPQKETVEEVILLGNMRGRRFKCVVGAQISVPRVP